MRPPLPLILEPQDALLANRVHQLTAAYADVLMRERPDAVVDALSERTLDAALKGIGADEGTLWLATPDEGALVPVWNNGPDSARFVGLFRLPISEGITGMVFTTGLSACESEVCFQPQQHRELDESLGVLTWAMLAVPLTFFSQVKGVVTAVKLVRFGENAPLPRCREEWPEGMGVPSSFAVDDFEALQHTALLLGRLIEHRLTRWAMGEEA